MPEPAEPEESAEPPAVDGLAKQHEHHPERSHQGVPIDDLHLPLPEEQEHETHFVAASFIGPLPPPAMLRAYDQILPGAADRIIRMTERQQEHDQEQERTRSKIIESHMNHQPDLVRRGQNISLTIGIAAMILAGYLAFLGFSGAAIGTVITAVGGISATSSVNRWAEAKEKEQRARRRKRRKKKRSKRRALPADTSA